MKKTLIEIVGWYGMAAILAAYALTIFKMLATNDAAYLWLNLTGSAGIVLVSWQKRNFQPMVLNIVWLAIALIGLLQVLT